MSNKRYDLFLDDLKKLMLEHGVKSIEADEHALDFYSPFESVIKIKFDNTQNFVHQKDKIVEHIYPVV